MTRQQQIQAANDVPASFGALLNMALEHFQEPIFLGEHSLLATPYLLGNYLSSDRADAKKRGEALQQVLQDALADMDYDEAELHRTILRERFFKGRTASDVRELDRVSLGKTQYFAHQKRAIAKFESYVVDRLNPAIRLERPLAKVPDLLDRAKPIERCLIRLRKNQTVMLIGASGTGKTSAGSRLTELWGENVLWFTVRPGINDHLGSFLFDLAYFCHLQGASWLWQELIASNGQPKLDRLSGIVRHTIENLPKTQLICIDEADLLNPSSDGNHAQFVQLLASLRGHMPILAMGQNSSVQADHHEELSGLSPTLASVLFKRSGVYLDDDDLYRFTDYTNGNPRLLDLCVALCQSNEPREDLLDRLQRSPTVPFLLSRILQRLSEIEVGITMDLAVFQTPAPADVWQSDVKTAHALALLHQKHLVQYDTRGAVFLLPAYREAISACIPEEKRFELHKKAAQLLGQRAQYTLAAYHLSKTNSPELAVWMWREVQQQEINRGQAYAALKLFRTLDTLPLSTAAKEQVKVFCATLENLVGSSARAQADLRSILVRTPLLQIEADELYGVVANNRSELEDAERHFRRAMTNAEQLLEVRLAYIYKGLAWRYRSERDLEKAWQSISLAKYEVENLQGVIQFERCEYLEAIETFQKALELAYRFKHDDGVAKTCNNLGRIYTIIGQFAEAAGWFEQAEAAYTQIGKVIALDGTRINRAFMYNLAGQHERAAALMQQLKEEKKRHEEEILPVLAALIDQNLAEALLGQGLLEQAEACVQQAIAQEETSIRPDSLRTYAEIKLHQGCYEEAESLVRSSIDLLQQNDDPDIYLLGYAYRSLAQILTAKNETALATEAQTKAIELFSEINLQNEVAKTLAITPEIHT